MQNGVRNTVEKKEIKRDLQSSFPSRFTPMMDAGYLTTSVVVLVGRCSLLLEGKFRRKLAPGLRQGRCMVAIFGPAPSFRRPAWLKRSSTRR